MWCRITDIKVATMCEIYQQIIYHQNLCSNSAQSYPLLYNLSFVKIVLVTMQTFYDKHI